MAKTQASGNRDRVTRHQILGATLITRLISAGRPEGTRIFWMTREWKDGEGRYEQYTITAEQALRLAIEMDRYNEANQESGR